MRVSTIRVSGGIKDHFKTTLIPSDATALRYGSTQKQIFKRQLGVIGLNMVRSVDAGDLERISHRIEMKSDDSRGEAN
jgi:hypothetical protein